jgi:catechol 2,3-dioxygenase-like lactoylglutathione lyase family enzyme
VTVLGGCHCGAVRFEVDLVPGDDEVLDCNCSVCTKKGFLHLIVAEDRFRIVAGEDRLATYTFGTHTAKHMFCTTCGVHAFYRPRSHPSSWDINVRCLDDVPVSRWRIRPFDGAHWDEAATALHARERLALANTTLVVRDYDEAIAFYVGVLGFELVEDTPIQGKRWVHVRSPGGAGLILGRAVTDEQRARIGDQTGGRVFLFVETDDFDREHRRLVSHGVRFVREPRVEAYGKVAVLLDLYGNRIDLIGR